MTEMPWVIETRLAPGQRVRRNPVWGVLALSLAMLGAIAFFICVAAMFSGYGDFVVYVLPGWGVLVLAAIAFTAVAFVKRGSVNAVLGVLAACTLVLTNPVLCLVLGIALRVI